MANHKDPAPAWLTTEYMENILREPLGLKSLKFSDCQVSAGSNEGDNYVGQIIRIVVTFAESNEKLSVIGKIKPKTAIAENLDEDHHLHETEANFLSFVLPQIQKLGFKSGPKFYYSDNARDILFMEDLTVRKFQLASKNSHLDLDHCLLAIEAFAAIHASSLLLIKQDPAILELFKSVVWKRNISPMLREFLKKSFNSLFRAMEKHNFRQDQIDYVHKIYKKVDRDGFPMAEKTDSSLNVIVHGDSWKNNMMFRYVGGKVQEVCLLDYQIATFSPFTIDLIYFLFSSAKTDVIVNNIDDLLLRYYEAFIKINPHRKDVTFDRIKRDVYERFDFGLLMTFVLRPFVTVIKPPDLETLMTVKAAFADMGHSCQCYADSLKEMLDFFEKNGVIEKYLTHEY